MNQRNRILAKKIKLGVLMDPISGIKVEKDTTLALLLAGQANGLILYYMEAKDLILRNGAVKAYMRKIEVKDDSNDWYNFLETSPEEPIDLGNLDALLMRKDPPFNMDFVYTTQLLEIAENQGLLVTNKPGSIRDANEKLFATWFPDLCPDTIVTKNITDLKVFLEDQEDIILKPLDGMGGISIFRLKKRDSNASVVFETMTRHGSLFCMAQKFLPAIKDGDKRILMIDGEPIPYSLARIPSRGETRGNLAAGGSGIVRKLSTRDWEICNRVKQELKDRGLIFVGLDVIGDHLTEINVTSPTCLREIEKETKIDIGSKLIQVILEKIRLS